MAQQLSNILVRAPAFQGLNTEDSPLGQDLTYALSADNAVIDRLGRLGSRLAFATETKTLSTTETNNVQMVRKTKEVMQLYGGDIDGTYYVLAIVRVQQFAADNSVLQENWFVCTRVNDTLVGLPLSGLINEDLSDAHIIHFNNALYIFSKDNPALIYNGSVLRKMNDEANYIPPQDDTGVIAANIDGEVALAAYGRLWVAGVGGDYNVIHYSDLLIGNQWYDGKATPDDTQNTGGIIDVAQYWPKGGDEIISIKAHNNFLVVFGRESILVYANAATGDPAGQDGIFLQDSMKNIGCVARDASVNTGADVLFVDDSGIRSLGRTIQEKSVPIGDLSRNVRGDIRRVIGEADQSRICLDYWPAEDITVCLFPDTAQAFVMSALQPSNTGGMKMTKWNRCFFNKMHYHEHKGRTEMLLGANIDSRGLLKYTGYIEYNDKPFEFKWASMPLDFGSPTNAKLLKSIDYTIFSLFEETSAIARWGFDGNLTRKKAIGIDALIPAYYNEATFGDTTFGASGSTIRRYKINTTGSGDLVRIGLDIKIKGNEVSVQEINVQTLLGRTL